MLAVQSDRVLPGYGEIGTILRPTHAKVRKMMEEEPEDLLAIRPILLRVQDVVVPELVDRAGRYDSEFRIGPCQCEKNARTRAQPSW